MRKLIDDERLIYKCCSLYHLDNMGQQEICRILGISRPTVSRLLKAGRDLGIVKIEVINPGNKTYGELERTLEKSLHLQEVIITASSPLEDGHNKIHFPLGEATLHYLSRTLRQGDYVGVTMGMTLQNLVRTEYSVSESLRVTFVPLLGGLTENRIDIHSNLLAQELANIFGGKSVPFYAPALFSDAKILEGFKKEETIRKTYKLFHKVDVALMGIGLLEPTLSTVLRVGYIKKELLEDFQQKGAVGDIALQYFNRQGEGEPFIAHNSHVAGISLQDVRNIPNRIGIASGKEKAIPVLGAVAGGYINVLIMDIDCAQEIQRLTGEKE